MPRIQPLNPLGRAVHSRSNWDIEVNNPIIVFVALGWVDESVGIVLDGLFQEFVSLGELSNLLLPELFLLEHSFGQPLCKCEEGVMIDRQMHSHDGQHRLQ
jgi:hypothetical protein